MIATFLTDPLATGFPQVNHASWFQQDGATSHTTSVSMAAVRLLFHNHIISRNSDIIWRPRSPDRSVRVGVDFFYFLMVALKKQNVHITHTILKSWKKDFVKKIAGMSLEMLRRIMGNVWKTRGMPVQRQSSPRGCDLHERNGIPCTLSWHIFNLANTKCLFNSPVL